MVDRSHAGGPKLFSAESRRAFYEAHPSIALFMLLVVLAAPFAGLYVAGLLGVVVGVLVSAAAYVLTPCLWKGIGGRLIESAAFLSGLLLLDGRQEPLTIAHTHEGPDFDGFRRAVFTTFNQIAGFSTWDCCGDGVVTGIPAEVHRGIVGRVFRPGFADVSLEEHHVFHMVPDPLTIILGQCLAEIAEHFRRHTLL